MFVIGVRLRDGESFEQLFRRFKKQCEKAKILADVKKHFDFEKQSIKKKKKAIAAQKRILKKQRKRYR